MNSMNNNNNKSMNDSEMIYLVTREYSAPPVTLRQLPLYGHPGMTFYVIHMEAFICLSLSILACVVIFVLSCGRLHQKEKTTSRHKKAHTVERLIIYLAVMDCGFSISHLINHTFMMSLLDHSPDHVCIVLAFFINQFVIGQLLIVTVIAVNAFHMVVRQRCIQYGQRDWKILILAVGAPAIIGIAGVSTKTFGPSGVWCYVDMRQPQGPLISMLLACIFLVTFIIDLICYVAVCIKITKTSQRSILFNNTPSEKTNNKTNFLSKHHDVTQEKKHVNDGALARQFLRKKSHFSNTKYRRSLAIMLLIVALYLFQYLPYVIYAIWAMISTPHHYIFIVTAFFTNLGGVYNFFVYTYMRNSYGQQKDTRKNYELRQKSSTKNEMGTDGDNEDVLIPSASEIDNDSDKDISYSLSDTS